MKWFALIATAALFFMMFIFVIVSSVPPGAPNPEADKMSNYESCLQHWGGWGGASVEYQNNCKQVAGITP